MAYIRGRVPDRYMEAEKLPNQLPAETPAVSQPNHPNFFSGADMCRGCKQHKSVCKCALSKWHEIGDQLMPKQELFLRNYTQNEQLFGNATLSYADAYGYDLENADKTLQTDENGKEIEGSSQYERMYFNCASSASRMLKSVKISKHLDRLFGEMLNDERVDRELAKIITNPYLKQEKIPAIREYNALKQRITKKVDLTSLGASLSISPDQQATLDRLLGKDIHAQPTSA